MPNPRRRLALIALTAVFILAGGAAAGWWWLDGRWRTSTDDAYVQGNLVQLTPLIAGTVVRINADETALAEAEASLAQTVRRVRELFANSNALRANVELREVELQRARDDLARRTGLPDARAVAEEDLRHAHAGVETAAAALKAAKEQLAASEVLVSRTTVNAHPDVEQAAARLKSAYLAAHRTSVVAPVTGYVAKRGVQVGQRVSAETAMLAIVPLADVWVDANFKETQLEHVRIGQRVALQADLYGGMTFHGSVVGLAPGTGAAFALLPPQNATGNWIKIVQRLPVRIRLDPHEVGAHPLRVGLSMDVTIDTHDRSGLMLAAAPPAQPAVTTSAYEGTLAEADRRVHTIVQANLGAPTGAYDSEALARR